MLWNLESDLKEQNIFLQVIIKFQQPENQNSINCMKQVYSTNRDITYITRYILFIHDQELKSMIWETKSLIKNQKINIYKCKNT